MRSLWRMCIIFSTLLRHTINRRTISKKHKSMRRLSWLNPFSYGYKNNRGKAMRITLEKLGPIFIKFGQILSVRSDLLPPDIVQELEKLQDNTPPFDSQLAITTIEKSLKQPINTLFAQFDSTPIAAASVAQVHAATLNTGEEVIVKVIRPGIKKTIHQDLKLMHRAAKIIERCLSLGKLFKLDELVSEFEHTIIHELDLQREAANASLLKRNFKNSKIMYVPTIYWDYCQPNVMVMERIFATKISDIETLHNNNTNLKQLAENGVEIFFTQVLRDNFFHADMHPGNLFVDISNPQLPRYIGVDFGIMGQLSEEDQAYIGQNLLAFFNRDYHEVARLHIDSGWVPNDVRIDQLEASIRAIAEPIFQKPLNEISFGQLLLKLIQVARLYEMPVQPQLLLLQKTLLGIEALGRKLYPELDLWQTAHPFLEKWVKQQKSPKRMLNHVCSQWQPQMKHLIELPGRLNQFLQLTAAQTQVKNKKSPLLFIIGSITCIGGITSLYLQTNLSAWIVSAGIALLIVDRVR
jgi:ubiquinone biosynthesis protein